MPDGRWWTGTRACGCTDWLEFPWVARESISNLLVCDGRFVIFAVRGKPQYVQFASIEGALIGQVRGPYFKGGSYRLSPITHHRLLADGWNAPRRENTTEGNYNRRWLHPVPLKEVVQLATHTLSKIYHIKSPQEIDIVQNTFDFEAEESLSGDDEAIQLRKGTLLRNSESGRSYRLLDFLGRGGFGSAYRAVQTAGEPLEGTVCIKASLSSESWHREAYFGSLLRGHTRTVQVHEAFAVKYSGEILYCLVSEYAERGSLDDYLASLKAPWPETRALREFTALLRTVAILHDMRAVHRDMTPQNVLVTRRGTLKLADFGAAVHKVGERPVRADILNPFFAPPLMDFGKIWSPQDDIYHLGCILAALLQGSASWNISPSEVRDLPCSVDTKEIIQRCIAPRHDRYSDARALIEALRQRQGGNAAKKKRRLPVSLRGKSIVFTGKLSMTRREAAELATARGARVQLRVTSQTDLIVVGERAPQWIAAQKGRKLLRVDREGELEHWIVELSESDFFRLAGKESTQRTIHRRPASGGLQA